jgi:hypothetical protein
MPPVTPRDIALNDPHIQKHAIDLIIAYMGERRKLGKKKIFGLHRHTTLSPHIVHQRVSLSWAVSAVPAKQSHMEGMERA